MRRFRPWMFALLAALLVLGWQALTVQANYGGNWTGLFRTGGRMRVPPHLTPTTLRSTHPQGYDGQFYRTLAHDPLLLRDTAKYLDSPLLRARRILVPLAVWILALGRAGAVDMVFILVIAACVSGGVYYLGRVMEEQHRPAALGLLFLAVPATLIAVDTMTVDVALAALTACFAWQLATGRERGLWITLAAAGLIRETGLLLPAACVLGALLHRDYRKAAVRASAVLPALAWYGYVYGVLPPGVAIPAWYHPRAGLGILRQALNPPRYPALAPAVERLVRGLDSLALAAMMALAAVAVLRVRRALPRAIGIALGLHVAFLLAMTSKGFWAVPYGYARIFAPLFVLLLAGTGARGEGKSLAAVAALCLLVTLRAGAELESQVEGVVRWALSP